MQGPSLSREGDRSITVQEERVTKGETGGYRHVIKKNHPVVPIKTEAEFHRYQERRCVELQGMICIYGVQKGQK